MGISTFKLLTPLGQRRAFVQFENIDNAVTFVTEHYPKLLITLQDPTDATPDGQFEAYLHYARRREEWDSRPQTGGNWTCPSVRPFVHRERILDGKADDRQCNYSNYPTRMKCKMCDALPMGELPHCYIIERF
jgi:hypothetical protein